MAVLFMVNLEGMIIVNWFMKVKLEQGLQLLKIFKEHTSKQCILDDFEFYEDRQKRIQEKKAKQQQFQKQVNFACISNCACLPLSCWFHIFF